MLVEQWVAPACGEEELLAREAMLGLHACYECLLSEKEEDVSRGVLEGHAFDFHRCLVRLSALNAERWVLRPKLRFFRAGIGEVLAQQNLGIPRRCC